MAALLRYARASSEPQALRTATLLLAELGGVQGLCRGSARGKMRSVLEKEQLPLAVIEVCEIAAELGRRAMAERVALRARRFTGPEEIAAWAKLQLGTLEHEEVWLLAFDTQHGLLGARRVAQGGLASCALLLRDVLQLGLQLGAAAFVLVHNHPSGEPTPSREDIQITHQILRAARLVGLTLLDHLVVCAGGYSSLLERGELSPPQN